MNTNTGSKNTNASVLDWKNKKPMMSDTLYKISFYGCLMYLGNKYQNFKPWNKIPHIKS